jgi:hypothetical protein
MSDLSLQLVHAWSDDPRGLCGQREPAHAVAGIADLERRLHALALGAVLEVFPRSECWQALAGLEGHWLLDSSQVARRSSPEVLAALQAEGLTGPRHNGRVWWQICRGIQGRFGGALRGLLGAGHDDALAIQAYLARHKATFPVLAGPVISARWLDLAHRLGGVRLDRWEALRIPLTPGQQAAARQFGMESESLHPQIVSALSVWERACRAPGGASCGLERCPRRG